MTDTDAPSRGVARPPATDRRLQNNDREAEGSAELVSPADTAARGHASNPATGAGEPGSRWRSWVLKDIGVPLGLHVATRIFQLWLLALMVPAEGGRFIDRLLIWDADWFIRIAEEGYEPGFSYDDSGALTGNGLAFLPLYPLSVRVVSALPGVSTHWVALSVAWVAAAVAAVLLAHLGTRLYSRRVGYFLVVLFSAQPMSIVLSMGYSEGLFCALALGTLLAVHRQAWLIAGACGFLAALTRPTGFALAGALVVAVAWYLWRGPTWAMETSTTEQPAAPLPVWRPVLAALIALAGAPLYWLWVGARTGRWDGWFLIQEVGWGTKWDFGASTREFIVSTLATGTDWVPVSTAMILLAAAVLVLIGLLQRVWLPLACYGLFAFILAVGSAGYYHSRPRMLVPVLVLLIPVAVALARTKPRIAIPIAIALTAAGCWYGAYMITVWPFTI